MIEPIANKTVVAEATDLAGVRTSNHQILPEVNASQIPTYVIVPHDAVDSTNVTAVELVKLAEAAVPQFVLLFVNATRAYEPPEGSVAPVPSICMVVVDKPK